MKTFEFENIQFLLGQNAQENWDLLNCNDEFLWLHLNSFPSCYVIIESTDVTQNMVEFAANLCKKNTKYKNVPNIKVCYTKCSNLKKGNEVGSVTFKSNRKKKTITI